jgi:nucleoside-diphosphate-sugar epimerase
VRALVRRPAAAGALAAQGVALVAGDLHDAGALARLVAGCSAVVHAAGAVRGASREAFTEVNVAGTDALLAAVAAAGEAPRLLLLSSLAAREPELSWYARSKRTAEELLAREHALDWVVLRPPAVYGPGDREMLPVFRGMSRGVAAVPGAIEARISLIHVTDLARAVVACLRSAATRHRTLSLCDGHPGGYDWRELAAIAAAVWGRSVRLWRVPGWLLDSVARVNIRAARVTGRAPMLTPAKLRELRHPNWVADNAGITAASGWAPRISLREGLEALRDSAL